ncbi:MAG: VOC family protein [Planctomycetia bacterium]|nr:VOC family protein [Planctomycetia bacterium]
MERPSLYSVELRTTDWLRLVEWYRDVVGLRVAVRMTKGQYALLVGGEGRLTIIGRPDSPELRVEVPESRWSLGFEAADLEATRVRLLAAGISCPPADEHPEGYRELTIRDPDGNRVRFFEFPRKNFA